MTVDERLSTSFLKLASMRHGRSFTVTLGGRDGHVGWTRRSRWVDATVTLDGRDGHATVTVTLPNHKNHCIEIKLNIELNIYNKYFKN